MILYYMFILGIIYYRYVIILVICFVWGGWVSSIGLCVGLCNRLLGLVSIGVVLI